MYICIEYTNHTNGIVSFIKKDLSKKSCTEGVFLGLFRSGSTLVFSSYPKEAKQLLNGYKKLRDQMTSIHDYSLSCVEVDNMTST